MPQPSMHDFINKYIKLSSLHFIEKSMIIITNSLGVISIVDCTLFNEHLNYYIRNCLFLDWPKHDLAALAGRVTDVMLAHP